MRSSAVSCSSCFANESCAAAIVCFECGTARISPGPEPAEYSNKHVSVAPLGAAGCAVAASQIAAKS